MVLVLCQIIFTALAPSRLGASLIDLVANKPPDVIGPKVWAKTASELVDSASLIAEEAVVFGDSAQPSDDEEGQALAAAVMSVEHLLESTKVAAPDLYAVAKLSAKRNGKLSSRRAAERCLAECGMLVGTYAALDLGEERDAFINAARPVSQTMPTAARLRALLVLCRGFHSPGFGASTHGWRKGKGTVHQLLASAMSAESTAAAAHNGHTPTTARQVGMSGAAALDARLADAPERIRQHRYGGYAHSPQKWAD